jgi:hypothetical protein
MPDFIPGLELSETFFIEAIQPLIAKHHPNLPYAAARLDWGSDVLGFDTPMSMDHGWGPKMTLYLTPRDLGIYHQTLDHLFANHLPLEVRDFPTHFAEPYADGGVMEKKADHPIHHMVTLTTIENFFDEYLGLDINHPPAPSDWLPLPQQKLRTLAAGRIFHDDLGLKEIRDQFHWYPHELWLYLMAVQWRRIDQDAPFVGRTGSAGDEFGSQLIAARLVREIMRLGFLLSQNYAPYAKWFSAAFTDLPIALRLKPYLDEVLNCSYWSKREERLNNAYEVLMEYHANLKIPNQTISGLSSFHNRPFIVPDGDRFVQALRSEITDPEVRRLPAHLGNVDQICDNTDVLEDPQNCRALIRSLMDEKK